MKQVKQEAVDRQASPATVSYARGAPRIPATAFGRPRLLERLDSWPDVTVVEGPIGSGKTALLASWTPTLNVPVLWCTPTAGHLPFADLDAFAAAGPGVVVVDDGEGINASEFARFGSLIDHAPGLHFVVISRRRDTASTIAASCNAAIDRIGPDELLVTLDELRDAGLLEDDAARIEVLQRTEGLAVAVRAQLDDTLRGSTGAGERLRYLLRTGMQGYSGMYEAALRIALVPRLDRTIISTWGIAEQHCDSMDEHGFAEWDGDWLRMHPYTRGVLRADAEVELDAAERRRLVTTAVRASLITHHPLEALRLAFEIDDLALAAEVVFANMIELLESRDATYELFRTVPASKLRGHPGLTVMLVLLSNMKPDTRPRALQLLATQSLLQRVHPSRGTHRERVVYRAFEAALVRLTPFSHRALPMIRRAVDDFEALSEADSAALGRMGPLLQVHLGIGALYLRDTELAHRCFALADAKHVEAGRADRVDPLSLRAGLAALGGELPLARRLLAEADAAPWPEGWRESSPADFFNLGNAIVALEAGDPHATERHLALAGPAEDMIEHWQFYALVRARRDRLAGEVVVGLMRLRQLRERRGSAPGTAMARSLVDAAEASLLLATGDAGAARKVAARSARHSFTCKVVLAHAELALDRPAAAAILAQQVLGVSKQTSTPSTPTPRSRLEAELVLACVALRAEHDAEAVVISQRIAEQIATTGMRSPLRTIPHADQRALKALLDRAGVDQSIVALIGCDSLPREPAAAPVAALTRREQVVLEALTETGALDEIAAQLFVSRNTVKSQVNSLYRKLGVSSREAALTRAAVLGLIH